MHHKTINMKNRKIFVVGASGFQGGAIAQTLVENGNTVTTLKRDAEQGMPVATGVEAISGGLENVESVQKAMQGAHAAVLTLPLLFDVEQVKQLTANFIEAAQVEKIELVVFNASFHLPAEKVGMISLDVKVEAMELLKASGLNVITLMPDVYIDNLAAPWSIPLVVGQHILPYPVQSGEKIPWISHVDLAQSVAAALDHPELAGQTLPIGGNLFTGEEIAEAISKEIGETVSFIGITPNDFENNLVESFGAVAAKEISNLYRYVDAEKQSLRSKDFAATRAILNVEPQPLSAWVSSIQWK